MTGPKLMEDTITQIKAEILKQDYKVGAHELDLAKNAKRATGAAPSAPWC